MVRGGISDGLKDLFLSFNVDIPYDSDGKSFVRNILNEDLLRELVSEIRNLSDGVLITKENPSVLITKENSKMKAVKPKTMLVYEIEIGGGIDELSEKTVIAYCTFSIKIIIIKLFNRRKILKTKKGTFYEAITA